MSDSPRTLIERLQSFLQREWHARGCAALDMYASWKDCDCGAAEFDSAIDDAIAELAARKGYVLVPEWQSLETAPKDGTHILMWHNGSISEAWWRAGVLQGHVWGGYGWSFPDYSQPQFWMPKPAAPSATNEEGK